MSLLNQIDLLAEIQIELIYEKVRVAESWALSVLDMFSILI